MDKNEIREELNNIRNTVVVILDCIDKIENELSPIVAIVGPPIAEVAVNWSAADETPTKAGIYMKDLNEATELKDMPIIGQISSIGDTTTFARKDKPGQGAVKNWVLSDTSGDMLVVFWDEQIEKVKDYMLGEYVEITKAWQVKRNKHGKLELHPGKYFEIKKVE